MWDSVVEFSPDVTYHFLTRNYHTVCWQKKVFCNEMTHFLNNEERKKDEPVRSTSRKKSIQQSTLARRFDNVGIINF